MVDALCSGRSVRKDVLVRIQFWAPIVKDNCKKVVLLLFIQYIHLPMEAFNWLKKLPKGAQKLPFSRHLVDSFLPLVFFNIFIINKLIFFTLHITIY